MYDKQISRILKETIVLSCFPGIGKTYTASLDSISCKDLDSSPYHWIGDRSTISNPLFPENYISKVIELKNQNKYDFIFVSSHDIVRNALKKANINFITVYPHKLDKNFYINTRLRSRNTGLNDDNFINLIDKMWNNWIPEPISYHNNSENIWLYRLYLNDLCTIMPFILESHKYSLINCIKYGQIDDGKYNELHYFGRVDEYGDIK